MSGILIPDPIMQWLGDDGLPLTGGLVYTYAAGSTTPLATYKDLALATPNSNPILLDAFGKAVIYGTASNYKIDVQSALGVSIDGYPRDNVSLATAPSSARYVLATVDAALPNAVSLGALTNGYLRQTVTAGLATLAASFAVTAVSGPFNPTGTSSLTGVMMGMGGTVTPAVTGRVQLAMTGTCFNTGANNGIRVQMRFGTGAAPANGDAPAGTTTGGRVQYLATSATDIAPFALFGIVTGLALNTAIWIDVSVSGINGGVATLNDVVITALEV